jgi:hypothetical protein
LSIGELQVKKPGIGTINDPETVLTSFHIKIRPSLTVNGNDISEELRIPIGMDIRIVANLSEEKGTIRIE